MAKRSNGEGSYITDKKRKLVIYQFYYIDTDGKRKRTRKAGRNRAEAKEKADAFLKALQQSDDNIGNPLKGGATTVGTWIDKWLEVTIKPNVRPKTFETYRGCLLNHIRPYFADIPLEKLTPLTLQEHFAYLKQYGSKDKAVLSNTTVRTVRRYFSMCLEDAIRNGLIIKNPIKLTKPPKQEKKEIITLTQNEISQLLENAGKADHELMCFMLPVLLRLALATGMRKGELFGLQWDDINFSHSCINLKRTLTYPKGKGAVLQAPKTKTGYRKILVGSEEIDMLANYKQQQAKYADELGDLFMSSNYVFTSKFGEPIRFSNFLRRHFRPLCDKCGISKDFVFHGLRHTHATMLLQKGIHPKVVQERLGHSSIKITLDTYSHIMPDMQEQADSAITSFFKNED